jgi:outer membrane lipoprotein carrier protein
MQHRFLFVTLLAALAAAACGRAEPREQAHDAPQAPSRAEAPGTPEIPGHEPAAGEAPPGSAPALSIEEGGHAAAPVGPSAGPAAPSGTTAGGAAPSAAEQPRGIGAASADEILQRVDRTYAGVRSMQADFVQHLRVPLLNVDQRSEGHLFQRRPDRFLMQFTDPAGDIMVADGRHFWMYTPSADRTQVIRTRLADGAAQVDLQQQFLSNPTERFAATLQGSETVAGRATHVLTLVPRGRSQYRQIRIWVDQQDNLVRRFEMTEENESVRRIELRNLRLNVELPDSLFRFSPPAGTQVFDQ